MQNTTNVFVILLSNFSTKLEKTRGLEKKIETKNVYGRTFERRNVIIPPYGLNVRDLKYDYFGH